MRNNQFLIFNGLTLFDSNCNISLKNRLKNFLKLKFLNNIYVHMLI